jgi:myo-inositol catabolism protein IolS
VVYRRFGKLDWQVSAVGMGTWNIGNQWGEIDDATAFATIQEALDQGVNLFDTAEAYGVPSGLSEERLGRALLGRRHQVHIVSKIGHWGRRTGAQVPITGVDAIRLCMHAILYRLRTDYVDVVLCHKSDIEDPSVFLEGFELLKQQGHLRAYGISSNDIEVVKRFNAHGTCSVVELEYSLLNRDAEAQLLPYCLEHGIAVLVRGPLRKGLLSGRYDPTATFTDSVRTRWYATEKGRRNLERDLANVARLKEHLAPGAEMIQAALRFALSHPTQPVAIPGAKSPAQMAMNASAGDRVLTADERLTLMEWLEEGTASAG